MRATTIVIVFAAAAIAASSVLAGTADEMIDCTGKTGAEEDACYAAAIALNEERWSRERAEQEKLLKLRAEYLGVLQRVFPGVNYIDVPSHPLVDRATLVGMHSAFGASSFDLGAPGRAVEAWIVKRAAPLTELGIRRVGVRGDGPGAGAAYFNVDAPRAGPTKVSAQ